MICLPFVESILVLFLHQHQLECMKLYHIHLGTEEACRAVAVAELQYLGQRSCHLAHGGW
jgi:hypothetical protein